MPTYITHTKHTTFKRLSTQTCAAGQVINNKQNKTGGHDIDKSGGKIPEINQSESL